MGWPIASRILLIQADCRVRVEGLLVSVRIHQRKDSRGDRVGGGRVGGGRVGGGRDGGGMDRGRRDCPAGYCFDLWGGWNI